LSGFSFGRDGGGEQGCSGAGIVDATIPDSVNVTAAEKQAVLAKGMSMNAWTNSNQSVVATSCHDRRQQTPGPLMPEGRQASPN